MANFKVSNMEIEGVYVLEPNIFEDERGYFYESHNIKDIRRIIGKDYNFVQDNHSFSNKNVLRGLHFQIQRPQGKLIRVISGKVLDVFVDLRVNSLTFKKWGSLILSSDNRKQIWIPPGLAHGFLVLSDNAEVIYKATDFWYPEFEKTLIWNDQIIGIDWPNIIAPIVSNKDRQGNSFKDLLFFLR